MREIPAAARAAHDEGRRLSETGKYAEALQAYARAATLAPGWPYPAYDAAFTHLLLGHDDEALAAYEEVDRLAPRGFFASKTAIWALRAERERRFPRGLYRRLLQIGLSEPDEQGRLASDIVSRFPRYAPVYLELAKRSQEVGEALAWIDMGLEAEPDVETQGVLRLNRATVLRAAGRLAEAEDELHAILTTPGITMAAEAFAKQLLEQPLG
jgi:tetratricopeptide (TPR) repeat protein